MVTDKDSEDKLAEVKWHCRRGMLELDVMLQNFVDSAYEGLRPEQQELFEELLKCEDQDLYNWLIGSEACPNSKFQDMLLVIRHMYAMSKNVEPA